MIQHCNPHSHKPASRFYVALISLVIIAGLSACGGGSSNSSRPSLSIESLDVDEGQKDTTAQLVFTITLSEDAGETLTLDYTTTDGTATAADNDFVAISSQVQIPQGSRTATVSITINGDDDFEQNEAFNLELSNPQGIALSEGSISGSGLINNDDDADPKGYFAGTATVDTSTTLSDLVGLAYNNRLLMFSKTGASNVLYDIAITGITVNDYTATADIYVDGAISQPDVEIINGTTNELKISGTLNGTGLANGAFSLDFDIVNNEAASLDRIVAVVNEEWAGQIYGQDNDGAYFRVDLSGQYTSVDDFTPKCLIQDNLSSTMLDINIFELSHEVQDGSGCTYTGINHTGFASVVTTTIADDTLYYAFTNGPASLFAVMTKP